MQIDGPYKMVGGVFDGPNGFNFRIVWGPDFKLDDKIVAEEVIKIANQAHAEGRKSMERDFKELLDLSNGLTKPRVVDFWNAVDEFNAWKKARGIE